MKRLVYLIEPETTRIEKVVAHNHHVYKIIRNWILPSRITIDQLHAL